LFWKYGLVTSLKHGRLWWGLK